MDKPTIPKELMPKLGLVDKDRIIHISSGQAQVTSTDPKVTIVKR